MTRWKPQWDHSAPFGGFGWRYAEDGVERVRDPRTAAEAICTLLHYLIAEQGTVEFDNLPLCIARRPALSAGNKTKAIVGTLREFWRIVRSPECR